MHSIECPACKLYNKTNQLKCFREVKYKKVFIVICNCFLHWLQARAFVMQKPLNVLFYLLLQIYSWLPVRQRVIYKVALLTHKVRATATPVYLSDLVRHSSVPQRPDTDPCTNSGSAFIRRSTAGRSPETDWTCSVHFFCCSPIRLELFTCWHQTVLEHFHIQAPLENSSVQTHLVHLCCKRLCIFGP